ncbi:hypothetical protein EDC14_1004190 [Hydrogenispora ethanolica]|uniref:Uncharacterized protein n=1 Tax=Hydrogenispora ethanolica TaxID=1082276 RepID=A0A4R1S708_HYDET|nr:hypothetical protein [Hydrogenispora ethanolica]TCL74252.1 hypothetical protein EDC14_1004190 [Hydrogenispora ethanolica]
MSQLTKFLKLAFGWKLGENGWNAEMDSNIQKIDAAVEGLEGKAHSHENKALLDAYTYSNEQIGQAVAAAEGGTAAPTENEKAALAGTSGEPSDTNRYVTNSDPRLSDARTPTAHNHDDRYFTEAELASAVDGSSGADKIGATGISGLTGATVQTVLESLKTAIDQKTMPTASATVLGGIKVGANLSIDANGVLSAEASSGESGPAFSNVLVGSTTIQADSAGDTLELAAGTGITLTPDATNDRVTIAGHSNANDPTADQKAALAGTSGTPGSTNKYVTNADPRLSDARTPVAHTHDERYFTETELGATTDGASGADMIGATAISGITGATVQAVLESLKTAIDQKTATIPMASATVLGGVKIGANLSIDANGVLSATASNSGSEVPLVIMPRMLGVWPWLAKKTTHNAFTLNPLIGLCWAVAFDGTYLYASVNGNPSSFVKIDPTTMTIIASLAFVGNETFNTLIFDGTYLYSTSTKFRFIKINPITMTIVGEFDFTSEGAYIFSLAFDGKHLYAGLATQPAKIVKIDPEAMTKVGDTLTITDGNSCAGLVFDGTYLYAGLISSPLKVVKINPATMTKVATFTAASDENRCNALFFDGTYLYVGSNTQPAKIIKIDPVTMIKVGATLSLATGEDYCGPITFDGVSLYVGLRTSPAKLVKIDPATMTKVGATLTMDGGIDRAGMLTCDGTYVYFGLHTSPTKIYKRDVFSSFI